MKPTLILLALLVVVLNSGMNVSFEYTSNWENTSWMDLNGEIHQAPEGKIEFMSYGAVWFKPVNGEKFDLNPQDYKWLKLNEGKGEQLIVPLPRNGAGSPLEAYQVLTWNDKYMLVNYMSSQSIAQYVFDFKQNKVENIQGLSTKSIEKKVTPHISGCDIMASISNPEGILYVTAKEPCGGEKTLADLMQYFEK